MKGIDGKSDVLLLSFYTLQAYNFLLAHKSSFAILLLLLLCIVRVRVCRCRMTMEEKLECMNMFFHLFLSLGSC